MQVGREEFSYVRLKRDERNVFRRRREEEDRAREKLTRCGLLESRGAKEKEKKPSGMRTEKSVQRLGGDRGRGRGEKRKAY